ncbi:MAG TPA: hypothetical protein IAA29_11955 [Candidatus Paenibacillus intestinavium]|nr:hypothetical protein [Candidatus Paenibacillus intestinavium]
MKTKLIKDAWESWEHLLFSRLENLDHFIETVQNDLSAAGMGFEDSAKLIRAKVLEMNHQIQSIKTGVRKRNIAKKSV